MSEILRMTTEDESERCESCGGTKKTSPLPIPLIVSADKNKFVRKIFWLCEDCKKALAETLKEES